MTSDKPAGRDEDRVSLFRHNVVAQMAALESDPRALAAYQAEAKRWADLDSEICEWWTRRGLT